MRQLLTLIALLLTTALFAQQQKKLSIYFAFNSSELDAVSKKSLDSFLITVRNGVNIIDMFGFCDAVGNNVYNDSLAMERITAVGNHLANTTIAKGEMGEIVALGKRKPLNRNLTEEERLQNRRVDIYCTNKDAMANAAKQSPPAKSIEKILSDPGTKAGDNIILHNLNFIGGRHFLIPGSDSTAIQLLNAMNNRSTLVIELQGHICCMFNPTDQGDSPDPDNPGVGLSVGRAKAVRDFLVQNGIAADRVTYKGFGISEPLIYPARTPEEMSRNRRVEVKIIKL